MAAYLKAQGWEQGSKVAILSKNCAWWLMSDLAIWMAGYVSVPLYPTLAHETVSRSFHALVKWSLLYVSNREVEILDMDGLLALSRSTRRHVEDLGISSMASLAHGQSAADQRANDRQAA